MEEETFAAVQQLAKQKRSEYYERLGKYAFLGQTEHMLPGLLYCAHCGKPLKRHKKVSHGKRQWYHYICPTHAADASRCQSVNIREEVQKVLFTTIRTQIDVAADLEALTKKLAAQPQCSERRSAHAARLEAVRRRRKRSQALQDSLYQNYVEQLMSEQEYRMLKARYKAEIAEAERQLAALEQEVCAEQAYTVENRFLTAFCAFTDADALTKEMAAALVARVDVDTKKQVVIHLRYRDEYAALLQWLKGGHSDAGCDVSSPVR